MKTLVKSGFDLVWRSVSLMMIYLRRFACLKADAWLLWLDIFCALSEIERIQVQLA
jgi:hypothetical protein